MKRKSVLVVAALALSIGFVSCKNDKKTDAETKVEQVIKEEIVIDDHTSENALDWAGTYQGVLPCADCPGIETTIVLNQDGTFSKVTVYQEKADAKFEDKGAFTWNDKGSIVVLKTETGETSQYQVAEGSILALDTAGNVIEGELAENYRLAKK
ncbi:copper resistance protein NlpE [Myroides pelagicus]|uniref:Copper resistance protein NlpE n=1 Tax=Myroides pelagicus TaxID=270914 RepID=A0A7K1GLN8_9FLAO|nr:copper resistance protein NlpE [Myroides pelagicus]MTH29736.1 copper resistance protein NlpE [Myroides pelagicus]